LVLHDDAMSGPRAAMPLMDDARRAGWVVLAPTLDYGPWASQADVRAKAAELLPGLQQLLDEADEHLGRPTRTRAFVYGERRGGQLAQFFALFYPEFVRGVATVNALPCTLPLASSGRPGEEAPLAFPAGLGDVAEYRGQPTDFEVLSQVSFWLRLPTDQAGGPLADCAWLERGFEPNRQVTLFSGLLVSLGAEVRVVRGAEPIPEVRPQALRFLEGLQLGT
jgi:pimeloyl-ACP methyl ester carboxylesterase